MNQQDYLKLIQEFIDQQYDTVDLDNVFTEENLAESRLHRMYNTINNGIINATKYNSKEIEKSFLNSRNFKIGNFLIKIIKITESDIDLSIYEEGTTNHLGRISKMTTKIDIVKDSRFNNCEYVKYFKSKTGFNIPYKVVVSIFRRLQIIYKLPAFV